MQKHSVEVLRTTGRNIIRDEGLPSLLERGARYLSNYTYKRIGDAFVRRFLNDDRSLPIHLRRPVFTPEGIRLDDYVHYCEFAKRHYRVIACHTNTNLRTSLPRDYRIGDIGCGDGRIAVEFHRHHPKVEYHGLDIEDERIDALQSNFSDTTYNFQHLDIHNERYNPDGKFSADEVKLPFPDDYFDLLLLYSVFTHMRPDGVQNYLSEFERILKADGKAWTSWYLILDDQDTNPQNRDYQFEPVTDGFYCQPETVLGRVAYEDGFLKDMVEQEDLVISNKIPGYWRDESLYTDANRENQDVVVFSPSQ